MNDQFLLSSAHAIQKEVTQKFPEWAEFVGGIQFKIWSMSRCAGRAYPIGRMIKLSRSYYLSRENFDADFRDTVLHEIAHLLTPDDRGHGSKWRATALKIGCNGHRCHTLSLASGFKKRRRRYIVAQCNCRQERFHARSFKNKELRGIGQLCQRCNKFFESRGEILA